ncbi:MAG: D-alanyl-D-alanine carboxypeptidase/D-alanyl-D-alanine endopeptidase [Gaiellaceae bacterium]
MRVVGPLAWCVAGALALAGVGAVNASGARPLGERLARALAVEGLDPTRIGALVVDTQTGRAIFARNPGSSLVPASTEKLPVAYTALSVLGPSYRARTLVLGRGTQKGALWKGHLVLKGFGDPSLHANDLRALARQLAARGIKRVSGSIIGDESYFDDERTAPGWQPSFYKVWSPPLSALIVNRAFFRGTIVDRPATAAARAFKAELKAAGIVVRRRAKAGRLKVAKAEQLASISSPTVEQLVAFMNTESDNFTAEMLLKLLGAEVHGAGTTAAGTRVVRAALRDAGVPLVGVRIVDGSGLSSLDRLTARAVVDLIEAARADTSIWPAFRGSLALAGVSGTLEDRMLKKPSRGAVRAKTGTTNLSSALSGIVKDRFIFSILMNGESVPAWLARPAQDRFATILARVA